MKLVLVSFYYVLSVIFTVEICNCSTELGCSSNSILNSNPNELSSVCSVCIEADESKSCNTLKGMGKTKVSTIDSLLKGKRFNRERLPFFEPFPKTVNMYRKKNWNPILKPIKETNDYDDKSSSISDSVPKKNFSLSFNDEYRDNNSHIPLKRAKVDLVSTGSVCYLGEGVSPSVGNVEKFSSTAIINEENLNKNSQSKLEDSSNHGTVVGSSPDSSRSL